MSLFEEVEPIVPDIQKESMDVKIGPAVYQGITIDTKKTNTVALQQYVSGAQWTVDYYRQILTPDQEPTPQDISREPAYQQYTRIMRYVIKVDQDLQISHTKESNTFGVTGAGYANALIPNSGDMFIADIGNGKAGLFTITSSTPEVYMNTAVYRIEWVMVQELTTERFDDLQRKVINSYTYSNSSMMNGCSPFLNEQTIAEQEYYKKIYYQIIDQYLTDFYSVENQTLLVPDQQTKVYDHFVVLAIIEILDNRIDRRLKKIKALNVMSERVMKQPTLWNSLIRCDRHAIEYGTQRVHLTTTMVSRWKPELQAIGYTGIPRFVFPMDAPTDVDSQYSYQNHNVPDGIPYSPGLPRRPICGPFKTQQERNLPWFKYPTAEELKSLPNWDKPVDLYPVAIDCYYVLSKHFYLGDLTLQSKLELLVNEYLNRVDLNKDSFKKLLGECFNWDNLERYYYHPILLILLKSVIK